MTAPRRGFIATEEEEEKLGQYMCCYGRTCVFDVCFSCAQVDY